MFPIYYVMTDEPDIKTDLIQQMAWFIVCMMFP